jgi:AraC family transcriptional regulator
VSSTRARLLSRVDLSPAAEALEPQEFSSTGITARHTGVNISEGMQYQWVGSAHYLALHDIHWNEAETNTDDKPRDPRHDLRGTLTFVPAGCRIWGWGEHSLKKQSFIALYLEPQKMREELAVELRHLPSYSQTYFSNPALRATLEKLRASITGVVPNHALYIESLCMVAMLELCVIQREPLRAAARSPGRLSRLQEIRIKEYVDSNMHLDIGLTEIAAIAKLSRFHFLRVFQNTFYETPYRYLVNRRIERARELLHTTRMSVAEVAMAVGYRDASGFSRAFSNVLGLTPSQSRAL